MKIFNAGLKDLPQLRLLLEQNELPVADVSEKNINNFYCVKKKRSVIGIIGVEIYYRSALLRSLAVDEKYYKNGIGKNLVTFIEKFCTDKGVKTLFLLTTTAESYFSKLKYKTIDRAILPIDIKNTAEYKILCPDTAIAMSKIIS